MLIIFILLCIISLIARHVDFIEEKGVVIVGEKTYHAALI